jgi:hypothetical protein
MLTDITVYQDIFVTEIFMHIISATNISWYTVMSVSMLYVHNLCHKYILVYSNYVHKVCPEITVYQDIFVAEIMYIKYAHRHYCIPRYICDRDYAH